MNRTSALAWVVWLVVTALPRISWSVPYGLENRAPIGAFLNNQLPQSQPALGAFKVVNAFPNLTFFNPTFLVPEPGTNRLYVGLREGKIWFFTNDPNTTNRTLFLDLSATTQGWDDCGLLGMVFHPEFGQPGSTNRGYVYVYRTYSATPQVPTSGRLPPTTPIYDRLSRFKVQDGSLVADPSSELILINQFDHHLYHNGGGIFFGADGFLYLSIGDEGDSNDDYDSAQTLSGGLFSGVFRIDVNKDPTKSHPIRRQPLSSGTGSPPSSSGNYYIPNDNPFLDPGGSILEEYWALGVRSPHRMTFDPISGRIWLGDVGEHTVEEVDLIQRGGNYQWAFKEGDFAGAKQMPSPLIGTNQPPIHDYIHADGNNCVIGGYVYRGTNFDSQLGGKYIFGDNGSGRIWSLVYNGSNAPKVTHIATMPPGFNYSGLSSFGLDQAGEIYMCQMGTNGNIWTLAPQDPAPQNPPALLSQTRAFTNLATLATTNGFIPYDVNAPLWSDAAHKYRWAAIPNNGAPYTASEQVSFSTNGEWTFPPGTVFMKHFELSTNENNPSLRKRLETRFLVCDTNGGVYGLTYKWRADNSDADLLTNSLNEDIVITTASGTRTQTWYYPSRQDCLTCHNSNAKFILGPKTRHLNGTYTYASTGVTDNQLRTWNHLGMFNSSLDENAITNLPATVNITNTSAPLVERVRSYLDANCAHCHRPNGVQAHFDARFDTPLMNQGLINGVVDDNLGITGAKIIVPTNILKSIMHLRMNLVGPHQMPPIAKNLVDTQAVAVLETWINSLPPTPDLPEPWLHQDIGGVGIAGDADYSGSQFTAIGSGADIYGNADAFHYIYRAVTGDVQIVARVKSLQYTDPWAKAGVMIRQSLDDFSRHSFMAITPGNGANFQYRLNNFDSSGNIEGMTNSAPAWVKLVRAGNIFSGFSSLDGATWTLTGVVTNVMPSTAYAGLAVCSHNNSSLNSATFEAVDVQVAAPPSLSISSIADQTIAEDSVTDPLAFTVSSATLPPWELNVSATSTNQTLVANTNIFIEGYTASRTVTIVPTQNQFGKTLITISVGDGANSVSSSFVLTVNAVNDPPTLNPIAQVSRNTSDKSFNVSFSGVSSGAPNESQTLSVNAISSATTICSVQSVSYTSPQSSGSVRLRVGGTAGMATITVTVDDGGSSSNTTSRSFLVYVKSSGNAAPQISSIANQSTPENTPTAPINFTVSDSVTPANLISVTGFSSNPALVPDANLAFSGTGTNRSLTITPAINRSGSTTITVSIVDTNFGSDFTTFTLNVTPTNSPPFVSALTNVVVAKNQSTPLVPFEIGDLESPASLLTLSGGCANPALVASSNIAFYGAGTNRAIVVTPNANQSGSATVNIIVSDGVATATNGFVLTVINGATNFAPAFESVADQFINENETWTLPVVAMDSDALTYSLEAPPLGMTIHPTTGLISWTPDESQGPSTNTIRVIANDDGSPSLTATQDFKVVVFEVNSPPTLAPRPDKFILAGSMLVLPNTATDADLPTNTFAFSLISAPEGMAINSVTGVLTWLPTNINAIETNVVQITVTDGGSPPLSATQSFRLIVLPTNSILTELPPPWLHSDIGQTALPGDANYSSNAFAVTASGTDILGNYDAFHFVYQHFTGDGEISARVVSVGSSDPWAKAGVMIRATTNDFSANVFLTVTIEHGVNFQFRTNDYDSTENFPGPQELAPHWVKLSRTGDSITGYSSPDGSNWTLVAVASNNFPVAVEIGFATTAHNNDTLNTAVFDNVTVLPYITNTAPILEPIANQVITELTPFNYTNAASDSDMPANVLTFALENAPEGMLVNTNSGVINWTPTEAQGPSTNLVRVIVSDDGAPSLSATQSFTIVVLESNTPPMLDSIPDQSVTELTSFSYTNSTSDSDWPANSLVFSLENSPEGMLIDTNSGVINWTPTEAQGPITNLVRVIVSDDGTPSLSATQAFTIIVLESNTLPVLDSISDQFVTELTPFTYTNSASDSDWPANSLAFSLENAPEGMVINTNSGVIEWAPTEAQGPSTNLVRVIVSDDGTPSLSVTQSFSIVVLETNDFPTLLPVADRIVHAGTLVTLTNSASDTDVPANALTFTLDFGAALGAHLDTTNGVFTWLTTDEVANSTNTFEIRVSDDGTPALSATQSFNITVVSRPHFQTITRSNETVILEWSAIPTQVYRVQWTDNIESPTWNDLGESVIADGEIATKLDSPGESSQRFYRILVGP